MGVEAEARGVGPERRLVRPRARDEEADAADPADDARERLERELEALLVDEPAGEQHEPLVGGGVLGAECREVVVRAQVERVDPVRDHGHRVLVDAEHVGDMAAHVVAADDHRVGAAGHRRLDRVDVRLRVLRDAALVATELGRVDRRDVRPSQP